ncbi:MAG: hypothetical protein DRP02_13355 [Candidatus Gerdarchaeota archaeon]|nr:MAG: hypothetical protein DRO63_07255 [Candidatus Gerdarchaeota archaeon]RLI68050.1 MAG: hypothetical protein DRP02_13355 [Candidatus Gerdarchaeota archaeon]
MTKQHVAIVTDASADIPPELEEKYKITILPILINFKEKSYKYRGIEKGLTWEEFYRIIETEVPTTAIPSPGIFKQTFEKALEIGDSLIGLFISQKMSAVYNTAKMVIEQYMTDKDITTYQTGVNSVGIATLVVEAARLAADGMSKEELVRKIESWLPKVQYAGIINKLDNLVRTGRLSKTKKFFADIFKFKPVVGFEEDEIHIYGQLRAEDKLILKQMKKFGRNALEKMHPEVRTFFIAHSRWPEAAEELQQYLLEHNPQKKEIIIQESGVLNAFFTGRKLLAYGYVGEFDPNWILEKD